MTEHDPDRDVTTWLQSIDDVQPSARLQRVVAEIPLRHPRAATLQAWWPFTSAWKAMLTAALVCALGVGAGASTFDESSTFDAGATESAATTDVHGADLAFALSLDAEMNEETTR